MAGGVQRSLMESDGGRGGRRRRLTSDGGFIVLSTLNTHTHTSVKHANLNTRIRAIIFVAYFKCNENVSYKIL